MDAVYQDVEYGVDDLPSRHFCRAASRLGGGDEGFQESPLRIREVAGVRSTCRSHPSSIADFYDSLSIPKPRSLNPVDEFIAPV
jgi:hypothetical protein